MENEILKHEAEIIKKEIEEKGFFTLNIPSHTNQLKKIEKIKDNIYSIIPIIAIIFILIVIKFNIKITITKELYDIFLGIFLFGYVLIVILLKKHKKSIEKKSIKSKNQENFKIIKRKNIVILEYRAYVEGKEFGIKNGDIFTNKKLIKFLSERIYVQSLAEPKTFEKNFLKLDLIQQLLDVLSEHIFDEINERKELQWKDKDLENAFLTLNNTVEKIFEIKESIESFNLERQGFNFEKFDSWLKQKIIFSIKSLKNLLQNQLKYCNYLLEKNKNSTQGQIILANKRLEIQKKSLQEQLFIIDEKIKKLEN